MSYQWLSLLLLIAFAAVTKSQFTKGGRQDTKGVPQPPQRGNIYVAVSDSGILLNEADGGEVVSSATVRDGVFRLRSSFGNVRVRLTGRPFVVTNNPATGKLIARYFTREDQKRVDAFQQQMQQQMQQIQQIMEPGFPFNKGYYVPDDAPFIKG